jgi:hypothetical protein
MTSSPIVMPIDLWTLNQYARTPGGLFGMPIIHRPSEICAKTAAAISQCRTMAVRV